MRLLFFPVLTLILSVQVLAQVSSDPELAEPWSAGIWAGYGFGTLRGSWAADPELGIVPGGECGTFESGSANRVAGGVGLERFVGPIARVRAALDVNWMQGTMRYPCVDPAETRMPDGSLAKAETEFIADVEMLTATLRLLYGISPFEAPLVIAGGPYASLRFGGKYSAREEIRSPRSASFVSGGQIRDNGERTFEGMTVGGGLAASIRFDAIAGPRLSIVPELDLRLALFEDVPAAELAHDAAIFWLGLHYRFAAEHAEPTPLDAATDAIPAAELFMRSLGAIADTLVITERRTISTRLDPLLPYIFFDSAGAEVPPRYARRTPAQADAFHESHLRDTTAVALYYNVLDIIGERMRRHPDAAITLSSSAPDAPGGAAAGLARARGETVARYLEEVWGIPELRIRIETRVLPVSPSNSDSPEGVAENRRVEIVSDQYEITAPILRSDTTTNVEIPPVELRTRTGSVDAGTPWRASIHASSSLAAQTGTGEPPRSIRFDLTPDDAPTVRMAGRLGGSLRIGPEGLASNSASATLPVAVRQMRQFEQGAGYYSLILFDFDSAELRPEHRRTIELVNDRIASASGVRVRGFTDLVGEVSHNAALSRERAARVAQELHANIESVEGLGETLLLYDNALPEGRFYSRCVTIESR